MLLLQDLRTVLPDRVAVADPCLPQEQPPVHWSYWSHEQTPYDRFAIGVWRKARVAEMPPESIAPFALRLVRSTDVFAHADELLGSTPIEWLRIRAVSITSRTDELYEIVTDAGILRTRWVFESCSRSSGRPFPLCSANCRTVCGQVSISACQHFSLSAFQLVSILLAEVLNCCPARVWEGSPSQTRYSTVTLLARLRGLSTSRPLSFATW